MNIEITLHIILCLFLGMCAMPKSLIHFFQYMGDSEIMSVIKDLKNSSNSSHPPPCLIQKAEGHCFDSQYLNNSYQIYYKLLSFRE